ncbi:MAG: YqgQ family protein [Candidatus Paralactobacillus gallistercoris]|uniref:YqgQ family protein n=1 Tax=Candidatus Paralactobacillus gallistercoris TaxID=2838724 RepID=A0A948TJ63_9LACO|nr:YqgQ family protein [Candidatus Paralactobacillus gallistercoris]
MKTLYDVQQLLKRFGTVIYVGKRIWDIELMDQEIKDLYEARLIDVKTYREARVILAAEHHREKINSLNAHDLEEKFK